MKVINRVGKLSIDKVIRSRRKTVSIEIKHDGSLIIRAPYLTSAAQIERLVNQKEPWIRRKQELAYQRNLEAQIKKFVPGEEFLYLGETYPLTIEANRDQAIVLGEQFIMAEYVIENAKHAFKDWYKSQARQVIRERVNTYARQNGFVYTQFRITSAKTRWGSCGPKGSLNFSYRLVMAPLEIIDYVVCHELVHLKVKDHSKNFWKELAHLMPDYQTRRQWLKDNGHRLTLE